ncbi:MAG TPA: hypothetical protein VEC19_06940 [Usitatibacter sp.]|nr:hypothetical protein [Usitatibacter sp.]
MYYQYPLETLARLRDSRSQLEFARQAREALPQGDDVVSEPLDRGLAIFAANEEALAGPTRVLQEIYGDGIEVRGPRIRYIPGDPLYEPIMHVRIVTRRQWAWHVLNELKMRQGRILEECARGRDVIVRAEVPLALMLGFEALLEAMTHGQATSTSRLSRYAPVPPKDPVREAA